MTEHRVRVHTVHLMDVEQRYVAADPCAVNPPVGCYHLHPPLPTKYNYNCAVYCQYLAQTPILILLSDGRLNVELVGLEAPEMIVRGLLVAVEAG